MATANLNSFPVPETVVCPSCAGNITLHDPAGSEFCVCPHCHTYIKFRNDVPQAVKKASLPQTKPVVAIGAQIVLQGYTFKVIAFIEKREKGTEYYWREYMLYNYEKGYANLSEFDGHWNLFFGSNFLPDLKNVDQKTQSVKFQDVVYNKFHAYLCELTAFTGEFDWDLTQDSIFTHETIAPPFIMLKEVETDNRRYGTLFYRGEYQEPAALAAAFGIHESQMPERVGIGANQPTKAYGFWQWVLKYSLYALLALMGITLFFALRKPSKTIFEKTFPIVYEPVKGQFEFKPFMTPGFEVNDQSSFLDLEITSPIDNNWLEATIVLVNEQSNATWEVTQGIEYYNGVEDGERWTEGQTTAKVLLSEIPRGRYHLNVYTASGDPLRDQLAIRVTENGILWRNLLVCVLLLTIIPAIAWLMARNVEKKRWSNSDFSPYEE